MKKAFTLIELIVVIGIIAVLTGTLVVALSGSTDSAKAAKCLSNMHNLAMGVQAYAQTERDGNNRYPPAGSLQQYTSVKRTAVRAVQGWIGWSTDSSSGSYISPYSSDDLARHVSLTNGAVWRSVSMNSDVYVCPVHRETAMKALGSKSKIGPLWSYVMNAEFGWAHDSKPLSAAWRPRDFNEVGNKSRTLLFAELPYVDCRGFQKPDFSEGANKANDPVLQFNGCRGGGNEIIGFNHKSGKRDYFAHVCFVDGHTEKFRLPKNPDNGNLQNLTKWLCVPTEDRHIFDIAFEGDQYIQLKN